MNGPSSAMPESPLESPVVAPTNISATRRTAGSVSTDPWTHITLGEFLSSSGLWIGLVIAAAFLAAAVRLRRYREPI